MMPRFLLLLLLSLTPACRATAPTVSPPVAGTPRPSSVQEPFRSSKAVRWVRDSAEHRALFLQVFRAATARVEQAAVGRAPGTWAVVSDADETLIDNSLYQVERERQGLAFTPESWRTWTERREAVPLPGARDFLGRVRALGGRVAIVTNRREAECPDTEAVFAAHDLAYDVMLCRPDDGPSDKASRFEAVARGTTSAGLPPLEVIIFVGDNIRDFPALGLAVRSRGEEAFGDFGDRFFVVPNPMYGGWE